MAQRAPLDIAAEELHPGAENHLDLVAALEHRAQARQLAQGGGEVGVEIAREAGPLGNGVVHPDPNRFGFSPVGGLAEHRDSPPGPIGQGIQDLEGFVPASIVDEEKVGVGIVLQELRENVGPEPAGFVEAGDHEEGFRHRASDSTPGLEICLPIRTLWRNKELPRHGAGEFPVDEANRGQRASNAMGRSLAVLMLLCFGVLQLGDLGHPLFWQDEGETAMFGQRVLEHGYPKVHADGNVVYGMGIPLAQAVDAERDAYTGSLWGQYYLAAFGVWLAEDVENLHRRTGWVRLPFALLGVLGLGLLFLAVRPALVARAGSSAAAAAGFGLLLCLSTSLILHLREVRYYAPSLALLAAVVWLEFRRPPGRGLGGPGRALAMAVLWLLLFNFFHPAALAAAAWIGLEWLIWARRSAGGLRASLGQAWALWLVFLGFALLALGLAFAFGIPTLSRIFSARWDFGPAVYAANLFSLAQYLLRYEFLGPLLLAEVALFSQRRRRRPEDIDLLRLRASLLRLALLYAAVGAGNPIFFERYFVPVGPLLALALVLDLEMLWLWVRSSPGSIPARRGAMRFAAACGLVGVAILWLRAPELKGRVGEIAEPVRGPVDAAIEFIQARYPEPSGLLIATNYEAEPFMYYLGSRVVGRFHAATPEADAAEAAEAPDLVIPRSAQPRSLKAVRRYLLAGGFERYPLDVADVAYNNIPELAAGRLLSTTHRFATPRPGKDGPPLAIYERRAQP